MKNKRNLWPLGIVLTFILFICGTAGLIVLAASQKSDLIDENYYEQEIKYQSRIDSQERANKLATPATIHYDQASQRVEIKLPRNHSSASGKIELYRPSESKLDQSFPLSLNQNGVQILDGKKLQSGLWKIRVTWTFSGEEFNVSQKIVVQSFVAQTSKSAVSPISKSAGRTHAQSPADLEIRDTAGLETGATE